MYAETFLHSSRHCKCAMSSLKHVYCSVLTVVLFNRGTVTLFEYLFIVTMEQEFRPVRYGASFLFPEKHISV